MTRTTRLLAPAVLLGALTVVPAGTAALADGGSDVLPSAVEHADNTVTLPLLRGQSGGQTVWYVVLDASRSDAADRYGVNRSNKLDNARGTAAVQKARFVGGVLQFPATVDFRPVHRVVPGPTGFPPAVAEPGAVGAPGYTPLVELPDGTVLNAPHLANGTGRADKVVALDPSRARVRLEETDGFARGSAVKYLSTEASNPVAAALENVTYAPALDAAPGVGDDSTASSRATLVAFVNGQTGAANPQRQGLNSALLDGLAPLNVLAWTANQGRYSPLWDVHLAQWSAAAVAAGRNLRQESVSDVEDLAEDGVITSPGGAPFGPAGFVVNCPIVSVR